MSAAPRLVSSTQPPGPPVPAAPEPVDAPSAWADRDLPHSSEIPALVEALAIPAHVAPGLIAMAERREARVAFAAAAERRGRTLTFDADYGDPELQAERAFWALYEDKRHFPRLPWAAADAIAGPLVPGHLVTVAARTGGGKTTLLLSLLDRWADSGLGVSYMGLEQTPLELRTKWACLRAGVPPEAALAHDTSRLYGQPLAGAIASVGEALDWQRRPEIRSLVKFAPTKVVDVAMLAKVAKWTAGEGRQVLIVDHVDRIDHGDGFNAFAEMSRTIRTAKELAIEHKLIVILASQAKRPSDPLQRFMPMEESDMRGGGTKEEESDLILTAYRPLKPGTTAEQLREVRQGLLSESYVIQPDVMGLKNLKSRLIGTLKGRTCALRVDRGRVVDLEGGP